MAKHHPYQAGYDSSFSHVRKSCDHPGKQQNSSIRFSRWDYEIPPPPNMYGGVTVFFSPRSSPSLPRHRDTTPTSQFIASIPSYLPVLPVSFYPTRVDGGYTDRGNGYTGGHLQAPLEDPSPSSRSSLSLALFSLFPFFRHHSVANSHR